MSSRTRAVESYLTKRISRNRNMMIPFYIMCSYAYHRQDAPLVSDSWFDRLSRQLNSEWDSVKHFHKRYISRNEVAAGTYLGGYPGITEGAVNSLRNREF